MPIRPARTTAAAVAGVVHVREILADLGIIQKDAFAEKPYYDERFILHAPEERLLFNGHWQEGFIPTEGVPQWERDEHKRFFDEVHRLRQLRGADGRRVFVFPTVLSSEDPQWQALDRITLKQWMEQNGYKSPTLHWYLNYCCRDDYGTRYDRYRHGPGCTTTAAAGGRPPMPATVRG
jgi:hypothetical protein